MAALLAVPFVLPSCSGGQAGDPNNRGPFKLVLASTGLGQLYPYRITELDSKKRPTTKVINITTMDDLRNNVTQTNAVLPVAAFGTQARLPGGGDGNQFLLLRFSHDLKVESILSNLAANRSNSGLVGSIQVLEYDPATEVTQTIRGRCFIGGQTYYDDLSTPVLDLKLTTAVSADEDGVVTVEDSRAAGFPLGFGGDEDLVNTNSFVFIPDGDDNLKTFETMPDDKIYRIIVTGAVQDYRDKALVEEVCVATVKGNDTVAPQVIGYNTNNPKIKPGNGALGVDPTAPITVAFSKPIQPREVGAFFTASDLTPPFRGISLDVTIAANTAKIIYYADPRGPGDLCNFVIKPAYFFPGNVPVTVTVNTTIKGLGGSSLGTAVTTGFRTGKGPGLVNAPVAPEAIYIGRGGAEPGVSVLDLNGFGQGTGDIAKAQDGNYQFGYKRNPNLGQPGVYPPLTPGQTNMDAGSLGALTLTLDTNLSSLLLDSSLVATVSDIHIGQPLDKVFNNENINIYYARSNQTNPLTAAVINAWGNSITAAPIPNPPRLVFPPPNPARAIFGEDTTVNTTATSPPCPLVGPVNKLVKGNPFSLNQNSLGVFHASFPGVFHGPQPAPGSPQPPLAYCPYFSRQQVGHFLYVLDTERKQILVVNSNRFTVLETIKLSDPVAISISPNLKRLAVANFSSGTVTFIDTDPASAQFHTVVGESRVGNGPSAMAWQTEGEDLLVVNTISSSMSILRGADGVLRKTVGGLINSPIDVVCTLRQTNVGLALGFQTNIYFAYILNRNGTVAVYESGPDGVNGIGYNDVVGIPEQATFKRATSIQNDTVSWNSALYVTHVDESNLGQISHLELTSSPVGPLPISASSGGFILPPTFRQREWTVTGRLGGASATTPIRDRLSGNAPIDLAVDDMNNLGAFPPYKSTLFSNLTYADHSGKGVVVLNNGQAAPAVTPRFLFVGLADTGKLDVVELDTGKVVRTIDVPGIRTVANYWRQ